MRRADGKQAPRGTAEGVRGFSARHGSIRVGTRLRLAAAGSAVAAAALVAAHGCGQGESDSGADAGNSPAGAAPTVLDAGGEIPAPPNGAMLCPEGTCNYQTQVGCDDRQACWPFVSSDGDIAPACAPAGIRREGEACSDWPDCARGHACVDGKCRRLCCGGDWSACADGDGCIRRLALEVDGAALASGASLCYPVNTCDVLAPDACASEPDQTCQVVDPLGRTACSPAGSAAVGEPCSTAVICAAGLMCVADTCRRLCRAEEGAQPACPAEEGYCVHFSRDPEGVGECTQYDE